MEQQLLGKTLANKYRLIETRGGGAFGTVYLAHQYFCNQFVRPVAVKVSRQTGLDEESAADLFSDAIVLAQLLAGGDHDEGRLHLVQIHDMGLLPEYEGRAFLVMEHVDGVPLLSHLQAAGHFGVATGVRFIKEICKAVALIHRQGAIHRDLKADNVLIDRRGVVRVVDFGLATFTDPKLGFAAGSMGTFTYMAPETVIGKSTPASDVYSLGLLMYELFTGGGPHLNAGWRTDPNAPGRDENYDIKKSLAFRLPSEMQNEIRFDHRWLDGLILRCLDVEPTRRFANADELLRAILACEAGEQMPSLPAFPEEEILPAGPIELRREAGEGEQLFREVRRLLAARAYDQVVDRLDVHRPAEWAVLDARGARILRALAQAYLGRGDHGDARECLEQLRDAQKQQVLLSTEDFAAALSDLVKVYRKLGLSDLAQACQEEVRRLL